MAAKETSDRVLHNLSQVQEIIDDAREQIHKIQRETPDPVAIRFRVYGSVPFPIDMLRYDNCVPDEEIDSRSIDASFNPECGRLFVTLRKHSIGPPSYARWAKTGWSVEP